MRTIPALSRREKFVARAHVHTARLVEKHLHLCEKEISGRTNEAWKEGWKMKKGEGKAGFEKRWKRPSYRGFSPFRHNNLILDFIQKKPPPPFAEKGRLDCTVTNFARASFLSLPSLEQARSSETTLNSPLPPSEYGQFVEGKRAAKLTLSRLIKNLASHLLPFFYFNTKRGRISPFLSFVDTFPCFYSLAKGNWIKSHGYT